MAYNRVCAACGSILDAGEVCSCGSRNTAYRKIPGTKKPGGRENKKAYYEENVKAALEKYLAAAR